MTLPQIGGVMIRNFQNELSTKWTIETNDGWDIEMHLMLSQQNMQYFTASDIQRDCMLYNRWGKTGWTDQGWTKNLSSYLFRFNEYILVVDVL